MMIRQATPDDVDIYYSLFYTAGFYFFDYIFKDIKRDHRILINALYKANKGFFSYKNVWVAENNHQKLGMINCLPADQLKKLQYSLSIPFIKFFYQNLFQIFFRVQVFDLFLPNIHKKNGAYVNFLSVKPEFRGSGIGSQLLEFYIQHAKKNQLSCLFLDVSFKNTRAISLYEQFGFKIISTKRYPKIEEKYSLQGQHRMQLDLS